MDAVGEKKNKGRKRPREGKDSLLLLELPLQKLFILYIVDGVDVAQETERN